MDKKIIVAALAISLIAFVGVAVAMPYWHNGTGRYNASGNETWRNSSSNETWRDAPWSMPGIGPGTALNITRANASVINQFEQALNNSDYATAMQLHATYGLGGELFDKLNATTFAQYAQIYQLSDELRQELGLNQWGQGPLDEHAGLGQWFGCGAGHKFGFEGRMHDHTAKVTHNSANTTTTS